MPESNIIKLSISELQVFFVVLITGAIGGCAAGFAKERGFVKRKIGIAILSVIGYASTGIFGSLFVIGMGASIGRFETFEDLIFWSLASGFATSIALVSNNLMAKLIIKKLGIEIEVDLRRIEKEKSEED